MSTETSSKYHQMLFYTFWSNNQPLLTHRQSSKYHQIILCFLLTLKIGQVSVTVHRILCVCLCVCVHVCVGVGGFCWLCSYQSIAYSICTWTTHWFWYTRMYRCMKKNLKKYSTSLLDTGSEWHCTFNFFGEFYPLRVCEGAFLFLYILHVKHLAHELYDWLGLVECCGWHWNMMHRQ